MRNLFYITVLSEAKVKIQKPNEDYLDTNQIRKDLEEFVKQAGPLETPPCPNCKIHIPSQCNALCHDVAKALSIEPDRYPIEDKIVPLVYEIMSTNMLQTCWSCEGHMNEDGEIWKLPNVSFYSKSVFYPKLLLIHLSNLKLDHVLKYQWQIILSDYAQTIGVTYSIQPDLSRVDNPHLGQLQNDIKLISNGMLIKLKIIARKLLVSINHPLQTT